MGQQYSAVYRHVSRTVDKRLAELNISRLSISPRNLYQLRRRSYAVVLRNLQISRTPTELRELRGKRISADWFTPEETRTINRIVTILIIRCQRRSNQWRINLGLPTLPDSWAPSRTPPFVTSPTLLAQPASITNLESIDHEEGEIHGENLDELPEWALVTRLATSDAVKCPECPVCLIRFQNGDMLLTLPCFHLFHEHCALAWLCRQLVCPSCRTSPKEIASTQPSIVPLVPIPAYY